MDQRAQSLRAHGGFALDTSAAKQNFLPDGRTCLTFTTKSLKRLAKEEPAFVLDLSKEHIQDKSKANGLAKTLICLQALWFCIQCVSRLAQGLSISLLEPNTFGHALCTLLIHLLWWDKPMDIEEPTLIESDDVDELCAAMYMLNKALEYPMYELKMAESRLFISSTDPLIETSLG